jgi:hypothetical protein
MESSDPRAFRAEIVWKRSSAHSDTKQGRRNYGKIHDVLLFYTKGEEWTWNPVYTAYDRDYVDTFYRHTEPGTGRRYRLDNLTGPGGAAKGNPKYEVMGVTRYWRYSKKRMEELIRRGRVVQTKPGAVPAYKRYLDEMPGVPLQEIWTDIRPCGARAPPRLGFQTQKPEALLERIITVSSNAGDTILDPFCGCGTAIAVAERLDRRWIGIDITHHATNLIKHRLFDAFGGDCSEYDIIGEPVDEAGARVLAIGDRHAFQSWALGLVNARVTKGGKGPDRGVDGKLFFNDEPAGGRTKTIVFSVKSGRVSVRDVRDLRGTVEREKAQIGILLTLETPTGPMHAEAVEAGFYQSPWGRFPCLQIITIRELLDGTRSIEYPQDPSRESTYRRAPRVRRLPGQGEFDFTGRTESRVPSRGRAARAKGPSEQERRARSRRQRGA